MALQVHPTFLEHLLWLAARMREIGLSHTMEGQRRWVIPPYRTFLGDIPAWSGDTTDIRGMNQAFERTELNAQYSQSLMDINSPNKTGDMAAAKLQIDYLAAEERAFRTRHMSRIRAVAHNTARKLAHGDARGQYLGVVLPYVPNVLDDAADLPPVAPAAPAATAAEADQADLVATFD